ncbi:hypothetical protein ISS30_08525 [bacterium]|nr:hypothetical protein [FCB group bacterium]MBL7191728.1 hypothetical protein [bacterium]
MNKLLISPELSSPAQIRQISVDWGDFNRNITEAIIAGLRQGDNTPVCITGISGCGKSHRLMDICARLSEYPPFNGGINIRLNCGNPFLNEAGLLRKYILSVLSANGLSSKNDWYSALRDYFTKGNSLLILPEDLPAGGNDGVVEVLRELREAGAFILAASDENPHFEDLNFRNFTIPIPTINQLKEMLHKRDVKDSVIDRTMEFLEIFHDIIPALPKYTVDFAKIISLAPEISGANSAEILLDRYDDYHNRILDSLSPQQRTLLGIIASSETIPLPAELAEITGWQVQIVNSQLKRLRDNGILKLTGRKGRNRTHHYFTKPILRYHLNRKIFSHTPGLFTLLAEWRDYKKTGLRGVEALSKILETHHLPEFTPTEMIPFSTEINKFPREPYELLAKTAVNYLKAGHKIEAEHLLQTEIDRSLSLDQRGRAARGMLLLGLLRIIDGRLNEAYGSLKSAATHGEKHYMLWINLAAVNFQRGSLEAARKVLMEGIKSETDIPHFYSGLGSLFNTAGQYDKGGELLKRALQIDPHFAPAHLGLGNVRRIEADYEGALEEYMTALNIDPDSISIRMSAFDASFRLKNFGGCAELIAPALKLDDDEHTAVKAAAVHLLALIEKAEKRNYGEAEEHFLKTLKIGLQIPPDKMISLLTFAFFALAEMSEPQFWAKTLQYTIEQGYSSLTNILKLHDFAMGYMINPKEGGVKDILPPEEAAVFEEILEDIKGQK